MASDTASGFGKIQNNLKLRYFLNPGQHQQCAWKRNLAAGCDPKERERLCSDFARIRVWLYQLKCQILQLSCLFRVDPTATSDDRQETPLEIALGCSQHLEVLLILGKFMEMPNNAKHIQLAVLANRDEEEGPGTNEEFHKILNSLPVDLVGSLKKVFIDFYLSR